MYLPAIVGHVPEGMVKCMSAFLDTCYIARRQDIDNNALNSFEDALGRFMHLRKVFRTLGVRPTGFALPRQHSLVHYRRQVEDFGAPGGLCSSITESRHITAVKKPWRRSNRSEPMGQMLVTNQRLDKISAQKTKYTDLGMLPDGHAPPRYTLRTHVQKESRPNGDDSDSEDDGAVEGDVVMGHVILAWKRGMFLCRAEHALSDAEQRASIPGTSTVYHYT